MVVYWVRLRGTLELQEEQRRLTLHCHLLVWVFGYNDFASFRDLVDKTVPSDTGNLPSSWTGSSLTKFHR